MSKLSGYPRLAARGALLDGLDRLRRRPVSATARTARGYSFL
jgi:hypothetical protein